jgi:hypothetical protein
MDRRPRRLAPLLAGLAAAAVVGLGPARASAQEPELPQPAALPDTNPCHDPLLALSCPDLVMAAPRDLQVRRVGRQLRLLATNRIVNVGQGPLELRGRRDAEGGSYADAYQVIRSTRTRPLFFPEAGYVYWKAIPGQGHYWKYYRAARFELWTLNRDGTRARLQRTGPKLTYCFRDLRRVRSWPRSPTARIYPACSQDHGRSTLRLGVSPGWADIYPATYDENWISITGLRGCFSFVHRADPLGELIEAREDNNVGSRIIRLPPRHGSVAPRGCPAPR